MEFSKMRPIGFSTGALALGDFQRGVAALRHAGVKQVELSALREDELPLLLAWLDGRDLPEFEYVSVHAPSRLKRENEHSLVRRLMEVRGRGWRIIVHADVITEPAAWQSLGDSLCIENTDKRKPSGQGVAQMGNVFGPLPEATFCLDLGHARQVDPTMGQAYFMLREFRGRLRQIHLSEVDARSHHDRLSEAAALSFQQIADYVPLKVPIILESMIDPAGIADEISFARHALPVPSRVDERTPPVVSGRAHLGCG
jgi:hypothetical protein